MQAFNFIPTHRLEADHRQHRRRGWIAACVTYGVVLVSLSLGGWMVWWEDAGALADQLATAEDQFVQTRRLADSARDHLAMSEVTLQANRAISDQPDWSVLLALLSETLDDEVFLSTVALAPPMPAAPHARPGDRAAGPYRLNVSGYGRSPMAISQFVVGLENADVFDLVKVLQTKRQRLLADTAVAFDLGCTLNGLEVLP